MVSADIILQTKKWLSSFIIEHNICPFAKREYDNDSIHYEIVLSNKLEDQLQELIYSCEQLDNSEAIETSLLILPNGLNNFDDYIDLLELSNALMHKQGYEGIYQLASFHPDYCFEGVDADDASNFTNRSPYPMLHLIREASLEKVLAHYPNPEKIPNRNIEYTRGLGVVVLQQLLSSSKQL
ncbi:MAG: DUF1415 domain-containing protein [Cocleimonas sp.]|nr:DUF1415 domain-containing protein [Cocleimonas sp.]